MAMIMSIKILVTSRRMGGNGPIRTDNGRADGRQGEDGQGKEDQGEEEKTGDPEDKSESDEQEKNVMIAGGPENRTIPLVSGLFHEMVMLISFAKPFSSEGSF
jgi:hypothetical protein